MLNEEDESLSPEQWALVNAILYVDEDAEEIRQIVQSYKTKIDADDKTIAEFLFKLGDKLFTRENVAKATRLFSACIIMDPAFIRAYLRKAETYDWREKYDKEKEFLINAVEKFPKNPEILQVLAELYEFQHDYAGAATIYQKIIEINSQDGEIYLKLLQFLSDHQMYVDLAKIATERPLPPLIPRDLFRVFNFFVFAFEATQQYDRALMYADKALEYKPKRIALWEKKAKIYATLGRHKDALACYNQICLIKPQAKKYQDQRDKFANKHHLA